MLAAMVVTGIATFASVMTVRAAESGRYASLARLSGLAGLVLSLAALASHFGWGHRPGTPTALAFGDFLAEHPAPLVTAVVALTIIVLARRSQRTNDVPSTNGGYNQ